jgi:16S rRNA (uracil1498-N3)-methyltransferase
VANFYLVEELETTTVDAEVTVRGAEARHAVTVARTRVGESVVIGNGRGLTARTSVEAAAPDALVLRVTGTRSVPRASPRLVLAQALAKGGRDELAVQTATELGVDAVIPWSATRSVTRWAGQKASRGAQRWAAIVREATKQSMRPWLAEVGDLASTRELERHAETNRMLVLDPCADVALSTVRPDGRDLELVVGPEGGIEPNELHRLVAAGAQRVRLGDSVLRTSSAGPAAIAVLNIALCRW